MLERLELARLDDHLFRIHETDWEECGRFTLTTHTTPLGTRISHEDEHVRGQRADPSRLPRTSSSAHPFYGMNKNGCGELTSSSVRTEIVYLETLLCD